MRMLRATASPRRLAKSNNIKSNGQLSCANKGKKSKKEILTDDFKGKAEILYTRLKQSFSGCEFYAKGDSKKCERGDKECCEFVKEDPNYGGTTDQTYTVKDSDEKETKVT
jgi:hypothetical protein